MDWETVTGAVQDLIQDSFGESVVYMPLSGSSQTVSGVFSNAYVSVDLGDGAPTTSLSPQLAVKLGDLADAPRKGDRVEIRGTVYRIIESQEDGEGGTTLLLHK